MIWGYSTTQTLYNICSFQKVHKQSVIQNELVSTIMRGWTGGAGVRGWRVRNRGWRVRNRGWRGREAGVEGTGSGDRGGGEPEKIGAGN